MSTIPSITPVTGKAFQYTPTGVPQNTAFSLPAASVGTQNSGGGSGFFGFLGTAVSAIGNAIGNAKQREHQIEMYNQQRQDALDDYNRQRSDYLYDLANERAYNSPLMQVARLKEAGINPNTAFGNGNLANTSSGAQQMQSVRGSEFSQPSVNPLGSQIVDAIMPTMNASLMQLQAREMEENINLKKAEVIKTLNSSGLDFSKKQYQDLANSYASAMFETDLKKKVADTQNMISSTLLLNDELNYMRPMERQQIMQTINGMEQDLLSVIQQYEYFESIKDYELRIRKQEALMAEYSSIIRDSEAEFAKFENPESATTGFGRWWKKAKRELKSVGGVIGTVFHGSSTYNYQPSGGPVKKIGFK